MRKKAYGITMIPKSGTKIENAIESLLVALDIMYEKQKPLLGITVADFFVSPDLVIYADGDYWHSLQSVKERDRNINVRLANAGYRVLRFGESQIWSGIENIKSVIKKEICMPPAQSTAQQQAAGIAMAIKKGDLPASKAGPAARQMARMPSESLMEYAKTKHGNLPKHVSGGK